jgi:hypothetical protein
MLSTKHAIRKVFSNLSQTSGNGIFIKNGLHVWESTIQNIWKKLHCEG